MTSPVWIVGLMLSSAVFGLAIAQKSVGLIAFGVIGVLWFALRIGGVL